MSAPDSALPSTVEGCLFCHARLRGTSHVRVRSELVTEHDYSAGVNEYGFCMQCARAVAGALSALQSAADGGARRR